MISFEKPLYSPLKVGILIPSSLPVHGGAYQFEHTVFAEVIRRYHHSQHQDIRLIPIAPDATHIGSWNIDPSRCLFLNPKSSLTELSYLSRLNQKVSNLAGRSLKWLADKQPVTKLSISDLLRSNVHVLWSSSPYTLSTQIPFIITVWDLQHRLQPFFPEVADLSDWPWNTRQEHYMNVAAKAFCCVVGTKRGSSELTQFFGVDPSRIIVNPFPCPQPIKNKGYDNYIVLKRYNIERQKFLLYPAQFWSHKNHVSALYALKILIDDGADLKLVLPGSDRGNLQPIISMVNRLGLSDFVVTPGFLPSEDLASLFQNCLALIFPSFFGPDNLPPLEAMSYDVPAIVAEVPGSKEQYGNSVLYFDPYKPEDLANNVKLIMTDQCLRADLVLRGKALQLRLSPAAYVDRIEGLLLENRVALECCTLMHENSILDRVTK